MPSSKVSNGMRRLALTGLVVLAGCAVDKVAVSGGGGAEDGVLVNGTASGTAHIYDRFTGPDGSAITVGSYDSPPGEVIAYTQDHAPTINSPVTWTAGSDSINFAYDPTFRVKFKIWVVQGPFADGQTKAINACIRTSQIWHDERQGTGFSAFDISDATASTNAANYTAFDCSKAAAMKTDVGFDTGAVNVYWVNTVDFGQGAATSNGVWCGGDRVVAMGWSVLDHLFSHEIGHSFSLEHVNSLTTFFDTTNVMHNASNDRRFLTEGQTFRAVVNSGSVVNSLGGRGGPQRNCTNSTSTNDPACPAVQKRIWADGPSWPPN
ncbi:MAG TPA: hypothetical protein VHR45_20210 [Thermoanaerobaculia bacterium]|nr:hypothetical protein [Thermoanaerobaculia bacterium]